MKYSIAKHATSRKTARTAILATALAGVMSSSTVFADDITMKVGLVSSSIRPRSEKKPVTVIGYAPSVGLQIDLFQRTSFEASLQTLINYETKEISRNVVAGMIEFSLIGNSRKVVDRSEIGTATYLGGAALTALFRTGLQYYQLALNEGSTIIKGSTITTATGLGFRYDINDGQSVGLQALTSVISFANSTEGLEVAEFETALVYRIEL